MPQKTITIDRDGGDHRGEVRVAVCGFSNQNTVKMRDIVTAIESLPNSHLENLKEIRYDPERKYQTLLSRIFNRPHTNRFFAEFVLDLQSIFIYKIPDSESFFHTLFHELGHHVFFNVIGSELKKHWVTQVHSRQYPVSAYAKRNACENFSECYAFFKRDPEWLKEFPKQYRFFKEQVFKEYEPKHQSRDYVF